jgi:hypothetical protein
VKKQPGHKKNTPYRIKQNANLAKLASAQHKEKLLKQFPNIICLSDAVHDLHHSETHVVAIYISDDHAQGIPEKLTVKTLTGKDKEIATEIISGIGNGRLHFDQKTGILNDDWVASICCMIKLPEQTGTAIITSGHLYTKGYSDKANGWLSGEEIKQVMTDQNETIGHWHFLQINTEQDLAVIKLNASNNDPDFIKFGGKGFYKVTDKDVKKEKVTLVSKINGLREGTILDYNCVWPVPYYNETQYKNNVILIGSIDSRGNSTTLSAEGDSGGCVYHSSSKKLVGIILGGDAKYTWVLPIKETFDYWKLTLL